MDRMTRSAALETLVADMERSDDAAHVTGKIAALRLGIDKADPADIAGTMVQRWSSETDLHWRTLLHLARLCRWFRLNPNDAKVRDHLLGCDMTLADARAEMPRQLDQMIHAREQLAFWLDQQAKHRATVVDGLIALPPAANSDNPSISRTDAA